MLVDRLVAASSGRSIRCGPLRPARTSGASPVISLATLVDRGHPRGAPIRSWNWRGQEHSPAPATSAINVRLAEIDGLEEVTIEIMPGTCSTPKTLSREDALRVLDVAEDMADTRQRGRRSSRRCRGKTVVNLFFEDSTRTRISFEAAAKRLGADVINFFERKGSSVAKGRGPQGHRADRSPAMGADAVVLRHAASGARARLLADARLDRRPLSSTPATAPTSTRRRHSWTPSPSGSARYGDGQPRARPRGLRVTIVGDILHSRVARSNLWLLRTLGAEVTARRPAHPHPDRTSRTPGRSRSVPTSMPPSTSGPDALMDAAHPGRSG